MSVQEKDNAQGADRGFFEEFATVLNQPQFDPIAYLNDILPSVSISSQQVSSKNVRVTQLQSATAELQTCLADINTFNIRTSSDLTTLTDEILRSGSRLAYEVEVLRSDANTISEVLSEHLKDDISLFVTTNGTSDGNGLDDEGLQKLDAPIEHIGSGPGREPEFIAKLRLYGQVKARFESVVNVFGEALQWPLPPSDLSMASSLISVSAPELGMATTPEDDKAQEMLKKFRAEITELLNSNGRGSVGLELANQRLDELEQLASVWKGTSEERARMRFLDSLNKLVEDRRKATEESTMAMQRLQADSSGNRSSSMPGRFAKVAAESSGAASGLFRNLQRLKDEIYLD